MDQVLLLGFGCAFALSVGFFRLPQLRETLLELVLPTGEVGYSGALDNAPLGRVPKKQELQVYAGLALDALSAGKAISPTNTKPYGCSVKYDR